MKRVSIGIVTSITLGILLWWKFHLGQVRYFDADEFAYLHWAHNVFSGSAPYRDFFFYVPPGFLWFLAPLYFFVDGVEVLTISRAIAFIIYVALCAVLGLVFLHNQGKSDKVTNIWMIFLPGLFLSFLPLPADKLLEIRPDNLAILLAMFGLYLQLRSRYTWAGFWYGMSLLVLPKTLPQVGVAFLLMVAAWIAADKKGKPVRLKECLSMVFGLLISVVLFGIWIVLTARSFNDISMVFYSLTKLPFEVNRLGEIFPMRPDLFFYPNQVYYGVYGWNQGIVVNNILWLIGLVVGLWHVVIPWVQTRTGLDVWKSLLVPVTLLAYLVTFIHGYPMRHAQYLIPIVIFVAYYLAHLLVIFYRNAEVKYGVIFLIVYVGMCGWFVQSAHEVVRPKFAWTNYEDKRTIAHALASIPKGSYVLDLVGATIYFRDPYYVSSLPYGQYTQFMSRKLPSLEDALRGKTVEYIYQGKLARFNDLPVSDKQYVQTRYVAQTGDPSWLVKAP